MNSPVAEASHCLESPGNDFRTFSRTFQYRHFLVRPRSRLTESNIVRIQSSDGQICEIMECTGVRWAVVGLWRTNGLVVTTRRSTAVGGRSFAFMTSLFPGARSTRRSKPCTETLISPWLHFGHRTDTFIMRIAMPLHF